MKKITLLLICVVTIMTLSINVFAAERTEYFIKNEYAVGGNSAASDYGQNYIWKRVENVESCTKMNGADIYVIKYKEIPKLGNSYTEERTVTVTTGADNIMIIKTETKD